MENFHFSPSEYHQALLAKNVPRLAFAKHLDDVKEQQRIVRERFAQLLCWDDAPRPAGIKSWSIASKRCPWGTIEKIVFRSAECCDVPALLCLPDKPTTDTVFICLQGHSGKGMHVSIASEPSDWNVPLETLGDRDFAIGCMKRGIPAFCIEQSAFGERLELKQEKRASTFCHDAFVQALMLGKTLMGERVYDVARGIDYLHTRPELHFRHIGIMGNSGGGTISVYSAALLPEIDFCMPSCSFGTYADSKMAVYQCGCGYIPGILPEMEMDDVMALFAPKPVVIVAGKDDPIIPLKSVKIAYERLTAVYRALGAENQCRLVVGSEGHRFYADQAWSEMQPFLPGC